DREQLGATSRVVALPGRVVPYGAAEVLHGQRGGGTVGEVRVGVDPALRLRQVVAHVPGPGGEDQRSLQPLARGERGEVARQVNEPDGPVLLDEALAVGVGVEDDRLLAGARQD